MRFTVKHELLAGFGLVLVIFMAVSAYAYFQAKHIETVVEDLTDVRYPTVDASLSLLNGVNKSLAGLRGYMILGGDPAKANLFKEERALGWQAIDTSMENLRSYSSNWHSPDNLQRLADLEVVIEEFRTAQQQVESISHTPDNIPSYKLLFTEAAPAAAKVVEANTRIIDIESTLPATEERKRLLKLLADSRGSFALGLANIRAYLLSGDKKFREKFEKFWSTNQTRFDEIEKASSLFNTDQSKSWAEFKKQRAIFAELPQKMFELRSDVQWNTANFLLGTEAAPRAKKIKDLLHDMRLSQMAIAEEDASILEADAESLILFMEIGVVIALLIGVSISLFISKQITTALSAVSERTKQIANGDLSQPPLRLKGNNEFGDLAASINTMSSSIAYVVTGVVASAAELGESAEKLQKHAEQSSEGMNTQKSETMHAATAMEEMNATIQNMASNAMDAASATQSAEQEVVDGSALIEKNVETINELARDMESAMGTINQLGDSTKNVDAIVEVISGIAEQTNLLALNAAIEAARAGEQGRGFAVVADEVRTLAARTQESTEEIRSMLGQLKTDAGNAVSEMSAGHDQAQKSVDQAKHASQSISNISAAVAKINRLNSEIAAASKEQSNVAESMNNNIISIDTQSEVTLINAQKTGAAAHNVYALSDQLKESISRFSI